VTRSRQSWWAKGKPVNPQFWINAEITVNRDRRPTSTSVCSSHPGLRKIDFLNAKMVLVILHLFVPLYQVFCALGMEAESW
jgi:hypothetical protein